MGRKTHELEDASKQRTRGVKADANSACGSIDELQVRFREQWINAMNAFVP